MKIIIVDILEKGKIAGRLAFPTTKVADTMINTLDGIFNKKGKDSIEFKGKKVEMISDIKDLSRWYNKELKKHG